MESSIGVDNKTGLGSNDTTTAINFSLIKSEVNNQTKLIENQNEFTYENEIETETTEHEPLTSEKLDETFRKDYYRVYYSSSNSVTSSANKTCLNKLVEEKILDDQVKAFDLNESRQQNQQIVERSMLSLTQPNKTIISQTILEESKHEDLDTTTTTPTVEEIKAAAAVVINSVCEKNLLALYIYII